MDFLNNRLKEIIKELLANEEPVTSGYLSKVLAVTSRTIRNDISALNHELKKIGVKIDAQRGIGYFIQPTPDKKIRELIEELFQLNQPSEAQTLPILPEERVLYILKNIIMADDFITIEQLARELFVSKSTVDNDLKQVEKLLSKFDVSIYKKPNYGIKIAGNEMNIRFCLSDCLANIKNEQTKTVENNNHFLAEGIDIDLIENITKQHIQQLPFNIAEMPLNNLIMHIAIGIQRIKKGKNVELDKLELNHLEEEKEYVVASNIVKSLEREFSINIPDEEIAYITIHLLGAKRFRDGNILRDDFIELIGKSNYQLVIDILEEINTVYRIDLMDDKELIYGLGLHLRSAMNRMRYKMNLRNPMLKEIKKNYPFAFELAVVASDIILREHQMKINEDEIGYIAVHLAAAIESIKNKKKRKVRRVAIVCASGMGTAKLLAASIEGEFPGLNIVGTYPSYSLKDIENQDVDLILSTVPVKEERTIPILHINALLTEKDVDMVNNYISRRFLNDDQEKSFEKLRNLFSEELFFPEIEEEEPAAIIKSLASALNRKGYVDDSYLDSVLEREDISPTSIGNLVAIPHPVKQNALDSCIAIGILKKPVQWGGNHVQLVFLLALNEKDKEEFSTLFDRLWKVVHNKNLVEEFCKTSSFTVVMTKLGKIK